MVRLQRVELALTRKLKGMSEADGDRVVIRRTGESWFARVVFAGGVASGAVALLLTLDVYPLGTRIEAVVALVTLCWVLWQVGVRPKLILSRDRLIVINWFHRHDIPWQSVDRVTVDEGVHIITVDGHEYKPASGAASLASSIMRNRVQERMRDAILVARRKYQNSAGGFDQPATRLELNVRGYLAA